MNILKILAASAADQLADNRDAIAGLVIEAWDKYGEPVDLPGPDAIVDPIVRSTIVKRSAQ